MKIKAYKVIADAVEAACDAAAARCFKHVQHPTEEQIAEHCEREVMNALWDLIDFEDEVVEQPPTGPLGWAPR